MQIREWLFTIGYTFSYGALLAKLWRVYRIFHNPAPNKKVCNAICNLVYIFIHDTRIILNDIDWGYLPQIFKDWHLMMFTLVIVGIAVLLLFLGTVIPQLRGTIIEIRDLESPDGLSVCKLKSCII